MLTAVYLINRLPLSSTQATSPYFLLYGHQPDYSTLRPFGCLCYPWLRPYTSNKFDPRSSPCVFLGYASNSKGYKCLNPSTGKITISRHVTFQESTFPFLHTTLPASVQCPSPNSSPLLLVPTSTVSSAIARQSITPIPNETPPSPIHTPPHSSDNPTSHTITQPAHLPSPTTTSNIPPTIPSSTPPPVDPTPPTLPHKPGLTNIHPMQTRFKTGHTIPKIIFDLYHSTLPPNDPTCFSSAVKHAAWRDAMSSEFQALQTQGTWSLVPAPPSTNILGCKWTYKTKINADGSVARYKARLVAQGYKQQFGIDYNETFSPVAKISSIRILITIATSRHWPITQLDISNAFLHGTLHDTVYMSQPQGFTDNQHPDYVCKLHKALYGLKQSPRHWFSTLSDFLKSLGFTQSSADCSLLIYTQKSITLYMLIYVDDILLTGNDPQALSFILSKLHNRFQMRNLDPLSYFLGIQSTPTSHGLILHQSKYATDILNRAGMSDYKPIQNPTAPKSTSTTTLPLTSSDPALYRHLVGSLQYLTITRPDLSFVVNRLCQSMHQPQPTHFQQLKRVLRYLKATILLGLPIHPDTLSLRAFSDSDWAGDPGDRKSTTGCCLLLGSTPISWLVKKQRTVARSSTEAEYRALATTATEIMWTRQLLNELGETTTSPTPLFCDNISAISLAINPVFHARTKHIEVDVHFIRDCIKSKHIMVHHINTQDQLADIFTKSLPTSRFQQLRDKLSSSLNPQFTGPK